MNAKRLLNMQNALYVLFRSLCSSLCFSGSAAYELPGIYASLYSITPKAYEAIYNAVHDLDQKYTDFSGCLIASMYCGAVLEDPDLIIHEGENVYTKTRLVNFLEFIDSSPKFSIGNVVEVVSFVDTTILNAYKECNL